VTPLGRLTLSLAAALVMGVLAGNVYWDSRLRSATETTISMLSRQPLSDASKLAYRFGSAEHARILVEELRRAAPSSSDTAAIDEMVAQLHLATLRGEHEADAADSSHITSASAACLRFRPANCDPASMKKLAAKFAQRRRN
jgi:hypothetical protein